MFLKKSKTIVVFIVVGLLTACAGTKVPRHKDNIMIQYVDKSNYGQYVLNESGLVLVMFYKEDGPKSKLMARQFNRVFRDYAKYVKFRQFNVLPGTYLDNYQVSVLPSINFYKDGQLIDQIGGVSEDYYMSKYWARDIELWMRETVMQSVFGVRRELEYRFNNGPELEISTY